MENLLLPSVPFTLLFNCSLRILLPLWSSLRVAGFSPTFLVPHGLSRINVLLASYCWTQTTVPYSSIKTSRFETQPRTISSATFLWATIYWPSITSPHSSLPVTFSITMLIISLTISISYLAESSSTLAFQLLDLFSSKHLILHLTSAVDSHGHTHKILSLLRILFPSES